MGGAELSKQEIEIYDRQIRLWGVQAQRRMQNSKIYIAGVSALGAELAKNVVLAGMSVTLQDTEMVKMQDVQCQFLFDQDCVGKNRAQAALAKVQELNPLVKVDVSTDSLDQIGKEQIEKYSIVCVCVFDKVQQIRINGLCRDLGVCFYAASTFGLHGVVFADLGKHTYLQQSTEKVEEGKSAKKVSKTIDFCSMKDALQTKWKTLHSERKRGPKVPKVLVYWEVLQSYRAVNGRLPLMANYATLKKLASEMLTENGLEDDFISDAELQKLIDTANADVISIAAIVAGIIGQEIVKAISLQDEPICNFFLFDGMHGTGMVREIPVSTMVHPQKPVAKKQKIQVPVSIDLSE